jgi:hypothetical protein
LGTDLHGTQPALEASLILARCGVGAHRLGLRGYLGTISNEIAAAGNVHDGCIVCTALAIELLATALPEIPKAAHWLEEQRSNEWRGRRFDDGSLSKLGYNYTASAMRGLQIAGHQQVAGEIGEFLLSRSHNTLDRSGLYWDGVDIEPHVATGRVLEALQAQDSLPKSVSDAACRFIGSQLQSVHIRRLTREYDTWSLIGMVSCEGTAGPNNAAAKLNGLLTPDAWEGNGSWSQNLYRTAMFSRLILDGLKQGWNPPTQKANP